MFIGATSSVYFKKGIKRTLGNYSDNSSLAMSLLCGLGSICFATCMLADIALLFISQNWQTKDKFSPAIEQS